MMSGWHPGTKFLLLAGLVVVPYLWWTNSDPPRPAAPVVRAAADPGGAAPPPGALEPYALPPLERFAAVVERPLFSPTRRMPPIEEPPEVVEAPAEPAPEPPPAGPEEPELRFFGTVRQGGRALALVTFPATNAVARLGAGDRVGEWEVDQVEPNRLVLAIGEERREFEIFGAGSRSTPESVPGQAPGSESADSEIPDGELPPDELPPDELSIDDELPVDGEPSLEEPPLEEGPVE